MMRLFHNLTQFAFALALVFAPLQGAFAGFDFASASTGKVTEATAPVHGMQMAMKHIPGDQAKAPMQGGCEHCGQNGCHCGDHVCGMSHCGSIVMAALTVLPYTVSIPSSVVTPTANTRFATRSQSSLLRPPKA